MGQQAEAGKGQVTLIKALICGDIHGAGIGVLGVVYDHVLTAVFITAL